MKRYLSLDVLRGMTIALMLIVNNPGSWSRCFPVLQHATWNGCTLADVVYPFFLFCVGASMAFSFIKYKARDRNFLFKIVSRGASIILIGLLLNMFPFYPIHPDPELSTYDNWISWLSGIRIPGVLQRIGLCYMIGAILIVYLKKTPYIITASVLLMAAHICLSIALDTGNPLFSLNGCAAGKIDANVFGPDHCYQLDRGDGVLIAFDPEGLLGTLTSVCSVLMGYLSGRIIQRGQPRHAAVEKERKAYTKACATLAGYGTLSLVCALLLSHWIPINKMLWSASYVLFTGGLAMILSAVLVQIIEIWGYRKFFVPFEVFGRNSLLMFVVSGISARVISMIIQWSPSTVFGADGWTSLAYSLLFMTAHWLLAWVLYRKKIIIKI